MGCGAKKRHIEQATCAKYSDTVYFRFEECTESVAPPTTPVPEGWQTINYSTSSDCFVTDYFYYYVVARKLKKKLIESDRNSINSECHRAVYLVDIAII